jgi:glycosyltransferase involved in cell wall biosynthesis
LCRALAPVSVPMRDRPRTVLFNVSAPIGAIVRAKLAGRTVVLRIDGLYFDRLSSAFIETFGWPLRSLLRLGLRYRSLHDPLATLANLVNQNYTAFARILLADFVIYQSRFSELVHRRYFPGKPFEIIVNGAVPTPILPIRPPRVGGEIRIVAIYDDWKPAKRIYDLVSFVHWANELGRPMRLTILGYNGQLPRCAPPVLRAMLEASSHVRTLPRFAAFDGALRDTIGEQDLHLTFTYRDPCPNTMVELMAHGLPVVAFASGGVPDIVGDAGVLLPMDDFGDGFFSCHRFESDFPPVDFARVLAAVEAVLAALETYRARVERRFTDDLGMEVVAARYAAALRKAARLVVSAR